MGSFWGETIPTVICCCAYAATHLTKYCAYVVRFWLLVPAVMQPPSNLVLPTSAQPLPLVVFIQVGGVQGLPQNFRLGFTACAALM